MIAYAHYFTPLAILLSTVLWFYTDAEERHGFGRFELTELAVLAGMTIALRFYALDQVQNNFEGELSPYLVGATSLPGIIYANDGYLGPWAPLGYVYYLPIYVTTKLFGATILSVRLASAAMSTVVVGVMYGLLRRLSGNRAAIVGGLFMALDPLQIGWGRSDIYPFGSTALIAMLLVWATVNAMEYGRIRDYAAASVLMGLSVYQYPSGQVAVLIPIVFLLAPRGMVASVIGLGLWYFGYQRGELGMLDGRTSWGTASAFPSLILSNIRDLLWGVYVKVPYLFHQEYLPDFPNLPPRTVFGVAAVMALGAIWIKRSGVVYWWAVCGALPAALSAQAYAKRAAIMYPAIYALAAMTIARKRMPVWLVAVLVFAATLQQWFSGVHYPYGEAKEIGVARQIEPFLTPGTMVVADFTDDYQKGKMTFLLLDKLRESRVTWRVLRGESLSLWGQIPTGEMTKTIYLYEGKKGCEHPDVLSAQPLFTLCGLTPQ